MRRAVSAQSRTSQWQSVSGIQAHTHEALLHEAEREFRQGVAAFVAPALRDGQPLAFLLPRSKLDLVEDLAGEAAVVRRFEPLQVGRNPGRLLALFERLLDDHPGQQLHCISEPVWPGRDPKETLEVFRHEALVNRALAGRPIRLLCTYDVRALDRDAVALAERTHPRTVVSGMSTASAAYRPDIPSECETELPTPPHDARTYEVCRERLALLREAVRRFARCAGSSEEALHNVETVASELAGNALEHGGSPRRLRLWRAGGTLVCQVESRGEISDPLAGRRRPEPSPGAGLGLFIVHQLSDLVEVRTGRSTTIRAHFALG